MEKLQDFIFKKNVISNDTCDFLIEKVSKKSAWYRHSYEQRGDSKKVFFPSEEFETLHSCEEENKILLPIIETTIRDYNNFLIEKNSFENFQSYTGVTSCSNIKFNRCKINTRINAHHDHIHELFGEGNKGIPVLSVVGLLNNDFSGGEFILFRDLDIKLNKGDILLFPSTFLYPHRVEKIKSGTRYSFVTWAF